MNEIFSKPEFISALQSGALGIAVGTIFAIFAGIYYWFPKITGKKLNEVLGKIHFIFSLIFNS